MSLSKTIQQKPLASAIALALATFSLGVNAADSDKISYDQLDSELKVLLRSLESANEDAKAFKEANPVVLVAGDKGFALQSADKNFEFKLRGFIQADARYFDEGIKGLHPGVGKEPLNADDNFLLRRVRPTFEGTVYGKYGFRITPDFAGNSVTLADAYVDANWLPEFKVRAGKFRPMLELERIQSSTETKFIERSLISNFIPSRDVGVQINGDIFGNTVNYSLAYVNGANDGATAPNSDVDTDKEAQARFFYTPFGLFQGLGVGFAATTSDNKGGTGRTNLARYRTTGQEDFFGYRSDTNIAAATNPATTASQDTVYGDGRRTRLIPQFHYFKSNWGFFAEYVKEKQELTRYKSAAGVPDPKNYNDEVENDGWNLTAAWTITGEEQSLKGIKPFNNFDVAKGGAGAWELVFRVAELSIDKDAFKDASGVIGNSWSLADATKSAQRAQNAGIGVNWHLNKVVKVAVDYEVTRFDWGGGGTATDPDDRPEERLLVGRVQANF
jgi:phosphate-selective porin OprO and OprP